MAGVDFFPCERVLLSNIIDIEFISEGATSVDTCSLCSAGTYSHSGLLL